MVGPSPGYTGKADNRLANATLIQWNATSLFLHSKWDMNPLQYCIYNISGWHVDLVLYVSGCYCRCSTADNSHGYKWHDNRVRDSGCYRACKFCPFCFFFWVKIRMFWDLKIPSLDADLRVKMTEHFDQMFSSELDGMSISCHVRPPSHRPVRVYLPIFHRGSCLGRRDARTRAREQ